MNTSNVEQAFRRGIYCWCALSILSSFRDPLGLSAAAATTLALLALPPGGFIYACARASPDAATRRRRTAVAVAAAAYGLGLYGTTRLFLPRCSPAAVVAAIFGLAQASKLGLRAAARNPQAGEAVTRRSYAFWQRVYRVQNVLMGWLARALQSRNRAVRISLAVASCAALLAFLSSIQVFGTFMDMPTRLLPRARMRVREWRRWLRTRAPRFTFGRSAGLFEYEPLAGCTPETPRIRLLKLRRRWPFGPIRCELIDVDLRADMPEYEAVSYHWGRAAFTEHIYAGRRTLPVSPVVEELLYHLSSYTRERLVWIDALCINQRDRAEKDMQIPLMRDVYRRARSVIVWLDGVAEPWIVRRTLAGLWHEYVLGSAESCVALLVQLAEEQGGETDWARLMNLFAHPWFSRVWIIQELVMARSAVMLASGEPLQFDHIATFAHMLGANPYSLALQRSPLLGVHPDAIVGCSHAAYMATLAEAARRGSDTDDEPGGVADLATLLGAMSNFRATEDADRIYGLLGLLRPDEARQAHLRPDSSRPVEALYADVARHLLTASASASAAAPPPQLTLSYAGIGYPRRLDRLPSWAPDWTSVGQRDTGRLHFAQIQNTARFACAGPLLGIGAPFFAFEDTTTTATTNSDANGATTTTTTMTMIGYVFDLITHVGPEMGYTAPAATPPPRDELARVARAHLASRRLVLRHAARPYPTGQRAAEVFWRALVADSQFVRPAPAALGRGCRVWERVTAREGGLDWEEEGGTEGEDEEEEEVVLDEPALRLALEFNAARAMAAAGRAVAVTSSRWVGVVPPRTEVGDWVCVLRGLPTPFVLRPHDVVAGAEDGGGEGEARSRLFRLVGEAYVHGYMDGRAVIMAALMGMQPRLFRIV